MTSNHSQPHVLIVPYPAQGHLLPLLDLAHLLSHRFNLPITIALTSQNIPLLSSLLSSSPSIQPLSLNFPNYPSLPPNVENAKDLIPTTSNFIYLAHALSLLQPQILTWAHKTPHPPTAIISDFFCGWTHHLAIHLNISRITFSPSGAITLSINDLLWTKLPLKNVTDSVILDSLPNSPAYPWNHLSSLYRVYVEGHPLGEFMKENFRNNIKSFGCIYNTFQDLEQVYLDHEKKSHGTDRVWAVGPLSLQGPGRVGPSGPLGDLLTWLDGQEQGSVLYVCFGSQVILSSEQAEAVAAGLERSGVHFIWCVRQNNSNVEIPDKEFEKRVEARGRVIRGWAPQVELLEHFSVGYFLTHCGWNSILEAISAGVAMLSWPMGADQFYNARLLEEVGIGVRVCEGRGTVPDVEKLGMVVAEVVGGSGGEERTMAMEMRRKALDAIREGGSSYKDADDLAKMLGEVKVLGD